MVISAFTAVSIVALLTLLLASLLAVASIKLRVDEDPRVAHVYELLPHNNCGACGFPSCQMFAEALVAGKTAPANCTVSNASDKQVIVDYLHVDAGHQVRKVARLACAGGDNVATRQAHYQGEKSCAAATQVAGGGKTCTWGCLGLADCANACDFNAITMNEHGLPEVNEAQCTACGDCVIACPKDLFSLQPVTQHLWVRCKNLEQGDEVLQHCQVACTACGRCAMDAPDNLISMQNNLPHIRYPASMSSQQPDSTRRAIERCPTGAIVWFSDTGTAQHGAAARQIIRHSALNSEPS
ncbi:(Fe-S)-binding protein [Aestuariibacter salexigens]|uniref:(Fe-S)-binding protein n=1 Tax=Aestuariibacter salexigens TaxID=226010 RepID=UPI00040BDE6C|nr:(Fe-S)-binding protein [Aestuariibacter salexigens]